MKLGDIVRHKESPSIMGEVKYINENDVATLSLSGGGEIKVDMCYLLVLDKANQPHFEDRVVHILGTEYKILFKEDKDEHKLTTCDGFEDHSVKEIVIGIFEQDINSIKDLGAYTRKVMRHEIVHAFFYESGLWNNSHGCKAFAQDEELTDWIALQFPKLQKAFIEAGCAE
jgi:hypothetical protein